MSNYADGTCLRSCGCRIYYGEDDIEECRLHADAGALLTAAKAVLDRVSRKPYSFAAARIYSDIEELLRPVVESIERG